MFDKRAVYKESEFIALDDLVYAPLHALAQSNYQLRAQVVDAVRSMGTPVQSGQEESIRLNKLNIAYEQIRPDGDEGYSVDNLQMQVPLLSIVPLTNLNVEKAEIDFSTEVKAENDENGNCRMLARVCAPKQRKSDNLPRVSYKLKVGSIPATEGMMRITDQLSANHVAKKLDTTPIAVDGSPGSEKHKEAKEEITVLKEKIKRLRQLSEKVENMISEQERMEQISRTAYPEDTYEFDKGKYLMAQSNIANHIMEHQERIMDLEIGLGLEKDYE